MTLCYLYLLLCDISAEFDDFHTVEQWFGDGVEIIGSGNEQHPRQVVVAVEIVVVECLVLLGVEHFKQCRRRVAVMSVLCHLVNLVEDEHGIRRSCLLHTLDDTSRHGADICASVSAYLGLVVQTAE